MQNQDRSGSAAHGGGDAPAAGREEKDHFLRVMLFGPSDVVPGASRTPRSERVPGQYHPLPQTKLRPEAVYLLPAPSGGRPVRADSPAIEVMTDLHRVTPATTSGFTAIAEANRTMIAHGVRALFVVDDHHRVLGIVTASDILGEKPMQLTQQRGIHHDEILVRDIMTPVERLEVIDIGDVLHANVGDVVATLRRVGRQHALVFEQATDWAGGRPTVRGIFSLMQIARQLGITPQTPEIGRTFAEIEAAIAR